MDTIIASRAPMMARLGSALEHADPRLKILAALALSVMALHAGVAGLAAYALGLVIVCLALGAFRPGARGMFRSGMLFVLGWAVLVFLLGLRSNGAEQAGITAALSGTRLLVMLLVGLGLAQAASARQMGLALAWALKPVLGRKAWQAALSLALMVHFLPLALETLGRVRQTMRMRAVRGPVWRRMALTAQAALRILGQRTWTQAVAVAARRLDRPEAWEPHFSGGAVQWLVGGAVLAACVGLALV